MRTEIQNHYKIFGESRLAASPHAAAPCSAQRSRRPMRRCRSHSSPTAPIRFSLRTPQWSRSSRLADTKKRFLKEPAGVAKDVTVAVNTTLCTKDSLATELHPGSTLAVGWDLTAPCSLMVDRGQSRRIGSVRRDSSAYGSFRGRGGRCSVGRRQCSCISAYCLRPCRSMTLSAGSLISSSLARGLTGTPHRRGWRRRGGGRGLTGDMTVEEEQIGRASCRERVYVLV